MSRILILHAAVGLGHQRAAEALGRAFSLRRAARVCVEDTLEHGSAFFRHLYARSYLELSEKVPALWAYFYQRADENETQLSQALRLLVDQIGVTELDALLARYQPDAIVCTHFLPVDLLVERRHRGLATPPLFCVVTDFTGHVFWAYPGVDGYFVAAPLTSQMLTQRGVPADRITVTGIPVDPAIAEPKDRYQVRQAYEIGPGAVITLFGGGLAVARVRQIVTDLLDRDLPGTLIVVAGRNAGLVNALQGMPRTQRLKLRLFGFVDVVDDLVTASDLVLTKAGGMIVSEVLARGRPLVLVDPIPGQEEWNADYVVSVSAGVQVRLGAMVSVVVENLINHPAHRQLLEAGAAAAGHPEAAFAIADAVLARLGSSLGTQPGQG